MLGIKNIKYHIYNHTIRKCTHFGMLGKACMAVGNVIRYVKKCLVRHNS